MDTTHNASAYRLFKERLRALAGWESWLERPMQWLGFVWFALVVIDLIGPPNSVVQGLASAIWVVFVIDFSLRLALAPDKIRFVQRNVLTAVSLALPVLRVFRVTAAVRTVRAVRGLRLARLVGTVNRTMTALQQTIRRRGMQYVVFLTFAVALLGASGIYTFEKEVSSGRGIHDFGTALWWTSMMLTTMGSEYWPQTPEGRLLCLLLAIYAFAVFGYVTATIATFLIGREAEDPEGLVPAAQHVEKLLEEVAILRARIEEIAAGRTTVSPTG